MQGLCVRKVAVVIIENGLGEVGVGFHLFIVSGLMFYPNKNVPEKTTRGNYMIK